MEEFVEEHSSDLIVGSLIISDIVNAEGGLYVIKKFSTINNLAVFDDFEWDKSVLDKTGRPIRFEKINILYGRNYSGKTTLSRILRAMEAGVISDKYDNPCFSVEFDDGSFVTQSQLSAGIIIKRRCIISSTSINI